MGTITNDGNNNITNNIIGIDISKSWFDVDLNGGVKRFANDKQGINKCVKELSAGSCCFMESTSTYGYKLAAALQGMGHTVYIVNPLSVKNFARMKLMKVKSDKIDAKLLTEYGKVNIKDIKPYEFASEDIQSSKQSEAVIEQLIKQKTALQNQEEAIKQWPKPDKGVLRSLERVINQLEQEIKKLKAKIEEHITREDPEMLKEITSVKGVGKRTACYLIAHTNGFKGFGSAKKVSSYFGCTPGIIESGSSVKQRGRLNKIGFAGARKLLYVCALSAIRCNIACKSLYNRLIAKGKPVKSALMAVANKLIHQIYAVITKRELFDNNYIEKFGH